MYVYVHAYIHINIHTETYLKYILTDFFFFRIVLLEEFLTSGLLIQYQN